MSEKLIYRDCRMSDLDQLCVLLAQLWSEPAIDREKIRMVFQKGLVSATQHYFCAEQDNVVIGFCSLHIKNNLWQQGNLGYIDEIIVDSQHRGKGIGRRLLDRACRLAKERGCARIELDSAHHREAAHRFYQAHSFENRALLFSKILQ